MSQDTGQYIKLFGWIQNDNPQRGPERVLFGLRLFNQAVGLDIRTYYLAPDGRYKPTPRGTWIRLDSIAEAVEIMNGIRMIEIDELVEAHTGLVPVDKGEAKMDISMVTNGQQTLVDTTFDNIASALQATVPAPKRSRGRPRKVEQA